MYCIYRIRNLVNGKTYIGQHKYKRLNDSYLGSGILIRQAIEKYGKENFKKEILEANISTRELANDFEQMYILFERAKGKAEYNIADGGQGGCILKGENHPLYGKHHNPETCIKISEALTGKNLSLEHCQKISENHGKPMLGKHHTDEANEKNRQAHLGKKDSEETRRKKSESKKGKKFSSEHCLKIAESKKGKKRDLETCQKIRDALTGRTSSLETCRKISENSATPKVAIAYKEYKLNGGTLKWNEFQKEYKLGK